MSGGPLVDSGCHVLSENVWFVWSKTFHNGLKLRCHACERRTHTQLWQYSSDAELIVVPTWWHPTWENCDTVASVCSLVSAKVMCATLCSTLCATLCSTVCHMWHMCSTLCATHVCHMAHVGIRYLRYASSCICSAVQCGLHFCSYTPHELTKTKLRKGESQVRGKNYRPWNDGTLLHV